jgi:hypothetical protein
MYARVTRFEGGTAAGLRRATEEVEAARDQGPPPGVPSVGYTMLFDADTGTSIGIALFETEDALRIGDAALNEMSPSSPEAGHRVSVETFEVGADIRLQAAAS